MEAWRQWLLGERKNNVSRSQSKIDLTPTGLLMEGDFTHRAFSSGFGEKWKSYRLSHRSGT